MEQGLIQRRCFLGARDNGDLWRPLGWLASMLVAVVLMPAPAAGAPAAATSRGLELLTPADPVPSTIGSLTVLDPQGGRLVYSSIGPLPGATGGDLVASNLATRDPEGWRTSPITAPYLVRKFSFSTVFGIELAASSWDLASFVFGSRAPLLSGGPGEGRLGLYHLDADGELALLADLGAQGAFRGASADTSHVVFSTAQHLLPSDAGRTEGESVYQWDGSGLRQVDVATGGSLLSECGSSVPAENGVSSSGERIFFSNPRSCDPGDMRVYLREAGSKTVEISASHCERPDCGPVQSVDFAAANPSGSVAFLTTAQQLVDADLNERRDLYRYDAFSESLDLVSPGSAGMEGEVLNRDIVSSAGGSRVYFRAEGRLLPGQGAEAGTNLYLADGDGLRFLAAVESGDPLEASADGATAVLATAAQLTPGDDDAQVDVYRYDAETDGFARLSIGPAGGDGPFDATIVPSETQLGPQQFTRAIAEDGRRVFFGTAEALVATDRNDVLDVYGWEEGSLGLISSGAAGDPAEFAAASEHGGTVVFRTSASLLARDRDGGDMDLYASVVGGGFDESIPAVAACEPCASPPGPLVRGPSASAVSRSERRLGRIRLRGLGEEAGRRIVSGGRAVLVLSVPAPGKVTARGLAVLGGKRRTVARGVAGARRPGRLRLPLLVNEGARQALRRGGELRLRLVLRQADLRLTRVLTLRLGGAR